MDSIKSLNGLIETLKVSDAKDYVKIAKDMSIPLSDFNEYVSWKEEGYTRNCIIRTEAFELILLCWNKDVITSIHGHDNQKCWVYQVDGKMNEVRYGKDSGGRLVESHRIELNPGKLTYMDDSMGYHTLENATDKSAMTLHLYIKPVLSCEVFNKSLDRFEVKDLGFDTIDGKTVEERLD